jgi:hypothetical protein
VTIVSLRANVTPIKRVGTVQPKPKIATGYRNPLAINARRRPLPFRETQASDDYVGCANRMFDSHHQIACMLIALSTNPLKKCTCPGSLPVVLQVTVVHLVRNNENSELRYICSSNSYKFFHSGSHNAMSSFVSKIS